MKNQSFKNEDALVLMSGGQDSTTCLFWAIKNFKKVYAISFYYGQKHSVETEIAELICSENGVSLKKADISFIKDIVISNLFAGEGDVSKGHKLDEEVPASFVPYRNLLFLTVAAGWASTLNIRHLVTGICETDYSGYADCRDIFVKSAQVAINLSTDLSGRSLIIHTPLMFLSKAEEFNLADEMNVFDYIIDKTMTCYNGVREMNYYGMGCGKCPACQLRKKGYDVYMDKYGKND